MASLLTLLAEQRRSIISILSIFLLSSLFLFLLSTNFDRFSLASFSTNTISSSSSSSPSPSSISASRKELNSSLPTPPPPPPPPPAQPDTPPVSVSEQDEGEGEGNEVFDFKWKICTVWKGLQTSDYIPCLDNIKAIKALQSRRHMEHRERHCPSPPPKCLVALPRGYRDPLPWPRSRDMIWYNNVPHPKLAEYKKDQNWVRVSGNFLVFPGGGTQFKDGVRKYIDFIEQILPAVEWGRHTRVVLDVGCGVASFGGYLLDKNVITMSLAPKDEHEAQIQFALERGIPAILSVIGTQKLPFPDNSFDMLHCARCRVHWDANGGRPLLELNRVLRPGGVFVWSATPVYRKDEQDRTTWKAMVDLTNSMCWKTVVKSKESNGIGVVIYQKPVSNSCYFERKATDPPLCPKKDLPIIPWYSPLDDCISQINQKEPVEWPVPWPDRLQTVRSSLVPEENLITDTTHWKEIVSNIYLTDLGINWSSIRNVMDFNAGFGGFAAALIDMPLWVMNVVPASGPDTLPIIYNRGLIGVYHDWCESFNTYPRTYDLLHSSNLFGNTTRCDVIQIITEMDRILRPGKWIFLEESLDILKKVRPVFLSLHYKATIVKSQFLVCQKSFWRPDNIQKGS
ncbi:S-adenosyl-L-methionine-dependent methyltransferases superfamily protein [Rhynchospora pubera]|uniref:Methyltransferase n=1 Tax=Rhynchospora pubera TaxID=906938 RepID=A0AAV8HQQ3_9POAL|nr:S-adenosyl-L-methionine-dependent methyltransferases superfamily protein [Rhynchospora pubera]